MAHFAGDNERDRLDRVATKFVCTRDLAFSDIECTTRQEAHATLRVG